MEAHSPGEFWIGTAPVNWINDDVPTLRPPIGPQELLHQMAEAGYTATEWNAHLPDRPEELASALAAEGLRLASTFFPVAFRDPAAVAQALDELPRVAQLLTTLDQHQILLSDRVVPERSAWAGRASLPEAPRLSAEERRQVASGVAEVARRAQDLGLRAAFHHHAATFIETPEEVAWLMEAVDPELLDLCLDTGHYAYGGGDPVEAVRRFGRRVRYLHLKDVHPEKLAQARREGWTFEQAIARTLFPHLGEGMVDLPGVVRALAEVGYAGWAIVEQDSSDDPPLAAAIRNRRYLRERLGL